MNEEHAAHLKKIGLTFKDKALIINALTHRSYLNEKKDGGSSYERLEYLGDAILELITSEYLYHRFPRLPEGELTSLRAKIVQTKTLSQVAKTLGLGRLLRFSKGEAASGGQTNPSILADCLEAVIGAIYLDQGLTPAKKFVEAHLLNQSEELIGKAEVQDYKSKLQEVVQARKGNSPTYILLKAAGPDHNRDFTVAVVFFESEQALGHGKSKQEAEQQAAQKALEKLGQKQ